MIEFTIHVRLDHFTPESSQQQQFFSTHQFQSMSQASRHHDRSSFSVGESPFPEGESPKLASPMPSASKLAGRETLRPTKPHLLDDMAIKQTPPDCSVQQHHPFREPQRLTYLAQT
jgi:hypothetical protein